ncbi:MAG: trypsin-like peptidase domain-containing protein [Clostridia bacterium]|nr:trypsin-like peptidase domain-containing protein [Clostridia bacterium]
MSKKFGIFATIMIVIMSAFSIYIGISRGAGKDGMNGKSSYELAVQRGIFSGTELEYLMSLQGKDGKSVEIEDLYSAYLNEVGKTSDEYTYTEFITDYFDTLVVDDQTRATLTENATQTALRSTVDICYSYYVDSPIIYGEVTTVNGEQVFIINNENYASIGVSAGAGVIYQMNETTAYIITNYHVAYVSNYTTNPYRVYYDSSSQSYFTGTYDESKRETYTTRSMLGPSYNYYGIKMSDVEYAPLETHFLSSYGVYIYGYQSAGYELSATFVGGSSTNDIAVLKIEKSASENNAMLFNGNYKAADLGNSSQIYTGENVVAVGNPLLANTTSVNRNEYSNIADYVDGLKQTYVDALCLTSTDGVISEVSESATFQSITDSKTAMNLRLIRVSAAINAGNSGGSLFDLTGRLIGIVNGKVESSSYDNVGYAIPINIASRLADLIISQCDNTSNTEIKVIKLNSIGIELGEPYVAKADYDSSSLRWETVTYSTVKTSIGVAAAAGISDGNIITKVEIDGTVYSSSNYLKNAYDFNDLLLLISLNDVSTHTLKITVLESINNTVSEVEHTLTVDETNFVKIDA